ncbi:hypothetical protein ACFX2I_024621 [Malus domestica]
MGLQKSPRSRLRRLGEACRPAENILNGNQRSSISAGRVLELLNINKRFGWDNRDKIGWSRRAEEEKKVGEVFGEGGERRRERLVRVRQKMGMDERLGILEKCGGSFGNGVRLRKEKEGGFEGWMVENSKRFLGRETLLKKAYNKRMGRFS